MGNSEVMNNIEEVAAEIVERIQEKLVDCEVILKEQLRVNKSVPVILIRETDKTIAPVFHLYKYLECEMEIEEIVEFIVEEFEKQKDVSLDVSSLTDYQFVKEKLLVKLINFEKNQVLLQKHPHVKYLDLAMVFYVEVTFVQEGSAVMLINNEHLEMYHISKETLVEDALNNSVNYLPVTICGLTTKENNAMYGLRTKLPAFEKEVLKLGFSNEFIYVLSNDKEYQGASTILYPGVLETCGKHLGRNFFLIPNSVHEMFLVPAMLDGEGTEEGQAKCMQNMLEEVNNSVMEEEEILSYNVYRYDVQTNTLSIA